MAFWSARPIHAGWPMRLGDDELASKVCEADTAERSVQRSLAIDQPGSSLLQHIEK